MLKVTNKINTKTPQEINIMIEGGKKLARVKEALRDKVKEGVSAYDIEILACELIEKEKAQSSFKKVPGYSWATCVNINDGIVHGIPKKTIVFQSGDVVSVDCGVFYKGFHTDTSFTVGIGVNKELEKFIETGKKALYKAEKQARAGNRIYDISRVIENSLKEANYSPVRALVGHGVGKELHEDPQIHCFTFGDRDRSPEIPVGAVLAIEVMYSMGNGEVSLEEDGWTISTSDGRISGLFEDTVAVTENGPLVLTD